MCAEVPIRIYVFGASGCGATTLGAAVAKKLGLVHVDSDDHYWMPTDPPFSQKRSPEARVTSMAEALGSGGWVLSGAVNDWAAELIDQANLVVFATLKTPLRIQRLVAREKRLFGDRIEHGGDMHQIHEDFLEWAAGYDDPTFDGRSLAAHEHWLSMQTVPICRIDSSKPLETSVAQVLAHF